MKRAMTLGLVIVLATWLSGCETIKGIGRDITNAGQAIEDATR